MFDRSEKELWVWTELLAFDNTLPDFGAKRYLDEMGKRPDGITFLTGFDFVMQHEMGHEVVFPPDVCSRLGHRTNGWQSRQEWTNYQVRDLVAELHKYGVKVVINIWAHFLGNRFHHEFLSDANPERRSALIAPMNDGRIMGDYLLEKLAEVLNDYGFDGWHAADSVAAPWINLISPTDSLIRLFAEKQTGLPAFLQENADHDHPKRRRKLQYLHHFCWREWNDFLLDAWKRFWKQAVETVHARGKVLLVNSPNTKSIFGSLQYMNMDYRYLAEIGVDYLITETCTASCALVWHNRPLLHEFAAMTSEMTASMPNVKILLMPAVRDRVEGFDIIEHALPRLERDLHILNSQGIVRNGELERCADGFMFCLGDCVEGSEWKKFHKLYAQSVSFDAVRNGELVWLLDPKAFDTLREEHHRYGTWSPAAQITVLKNLRSIDISTIAAIGELEHISQPMIVPNFHLLEKEMREKILSRKLPQIFTGNFHPEDLPEGAETIYWKPGPDHFWSFVFLNWPEQKSGQVREVRPVPAVPNYNPKSFSDAEEFSLYREWYPMLDIPEDFWRAAADRIRELLGPLPVENEAEGVQVYRQYAADGTERLMQISHRDHYIESQCRIEPAGAEITVAGSWPKMPVCEQNGMLSHGEFGVRAIVIPPHGILVTDVKGKRP